MLKLSLFCLGFTSLVVQIITLRELMVSFYGNEFFIGWILFGWFIWTAIGCLSVKAFRHKPRGVSPLIFCHLLLSLLVVLEIFLIRVSKNFFITAPGQIPDLWPSMAASFFMLAPLCLALGLQFTLAFEAWSQQTPFQEGPALIGKSYFWETMGFVFGGAVFNSQWVFVNEVRVASILGFINLGASVILTFVLKNGRLKKGIWLILLGVFSLVLMSFQFASALNLQTSAWRFPHEKLLKTTNSIYGNLVATSTKGQYNFYHNGLPTGTNQDQAQNEYLVHFPMLSSPHPQKILLVGGGFNGVLGEILKYAPSQIFYAEMNPDLLGLDRLYVTKAGLDDPRVVLFKGDVRNFFKDLPDDFDVMIVNLASPSTAMINRYFTDDFYKQARLHLKPDGILSTHLAFSPDYVSDSLQDLGACLYKTLKGQFQCVGILPESTLIFIASGAPLIQDPRALIQRMNAAGISNYFVTAPYIMYRYSTDRIKAATDTFNVNKSGRNFDLFPRAYYYNLIYWCSVFHQDLVKVFQGMGKTPYGFLLILGLGLFALPFSLRSIPLKQGSMAAMFLGGFSLMAAEMLIIYGFQVFYGNLYYKIATIVCMIMAGMGLGSFLGHRVRTVVVRAVGWIHLLIGLYFLLWQFFLHLASSYHGILVQEIWIFLGVSIGAVVGFEFSYLARLVAPSDTSVYAADLMGSCVGVLISGIFLLPVYGVDNTLLFLGLINIVMALTAIGREFFPRQNTVPL